MKGKFIIITGPSAAGKTRLVDELLGIIPDSSRLITITTRAPREGEKDGIDYYFISRDEFEKRLRENEFFEHAEVYGNLYGSSSKVLEQFLDANDFVFAVIDVQGARTLKQKMPESRIIFLMPGSIYDVARRLKGGRMDVPTEEMQRRIETAKYEMTLGSEFDAVIENIEGHFNETIKVAKKLLLSGE